MIIELGNINTFQSLLASPQNWLQATSIDFRISKFGLRCEGTLNIPHILMTWDVKSAATVSAHAKPKTGGFGSSFTENYQPNSRCHLQESNNSAPNSLEFSSKRCWNIFQRHLHYPAPIFIHFGAVLVMSLYTATCPTKDVRISLSSSFQNTA